MPDAVSYLRVSGKSQIDGDGFPRQRKAVEKYSKSARLTIINEFRDEGVSGTTELEHRQGLAKLLDYVEANSIKTVLIERADRLARDLMVGEIILSQFREINVHVVAVDSGVDLTNNDNDPTRTLIRQVLGAVSQFEKSVIVLKLKAARERVRQSKGRCEGRKPFGTRKDEQTTLERMKQLWRKQPYQPRISYKKIAITLNSEDYTTRTGKSWRAAGVRRILHRI